MSIFRRMRVFNKEPIRCLIVIARRQVIQRFMRSLVVKIIEINVKLLLLFFEIPGDRIQGIAFQSTVHAFMPTVLLRAAFGDPFGNDAEQDKPDHKSAKASDALTGKRSAVIKAYGPRQPVLTKNGL